MSTSRDPTDSNSVKNGSLISCPMSSSTLCKHVTKMIKEGSIAHAQQQLGTPE